MRTNLDYRSPPGHVCSPMPTRDGCIDWLGRVGTRLWVWPPVGPFPVTPDCCSDLCCPLRWWPGWWQGRRVGSGQPVLLAAAAAENPCSVHAERKRQTWDGPSWLLLAPKALEEATCCDIVHLCLGDVIVDDLASHLGVWLLQPQPPARPPAMAGRLVAPPLALRVPILHHLFDGDLGWVVPRPLPP